MPHDPLLPRYVSPERARQLDDEWRARLSGAPSGHVPYATWSRQVDETCREHGIALAVPADLAARLPHPHPLPVGGRGAEMVDLLLQYQESFYRDAYQDPTFAFDRLKLHLPQERVTGILESLIRKEVNYPLVVATPQVIPAMDGSLSEADDEAMGRRAPPDPGRGGGERPRVEGVGPRANREVRPALPTLHRVLMDQLIRAKGIPVWQRTNPDVDTFLEQVRDVTLRDLTRTDVAAPSSDGAPALVFDEDHWLPYLQALYPTLPRPTVTPGYTDLSFVDWEQDPPASRLIPGARGPRGGTVTIQNRSQLDAVRYRYPLITVSRYLALFSQYHAATGAYLDSRTWSWVFGIVDPVRFPGGSSVHAYWNADGLCLYRGHPRNAYPYGRLRSSR